MDKNDIIEMAQNAGAIIGTFGFIAAAKREACAIFAEQGTGKPMKTQTLESCVAERKRMADTVRKRGN